MPDHEYIVDEPKVDALIAELTTLCAKPAVSEQFREILTTVVKLAKEGDDIGDFKLVNTTLKELRHAMRIFTPYRGTRKVVIFGSARAAPSDPCYKMAEELARALVESGFMVITGAGPGIMAAANKGAGKGRSFGINIKLPCEQGSNPYISGDPKLMTFKYFFTRKLMFIKESSATVIFPGGLGTQDEGFENLTLFQTGKSMPRPIVLAEPENGAYWENWITYIENELLAPGYISPEDMGLFHRTTTVGEALAYIKDYYRVYHSLGYARGRTVLRLNQAIAPQTLERLNDEFRDILIDGEFISAGPLEGEVSDNEYLGLARLTFNFNKRSYGRLNQLIKTINQSGKF